ncbi:transcription termination factor MTERF9, chloroplastic [Euphorbia lathyris]|uniref:transcription termination factor MTERF9, chloroplastic n=1 Tax=Euphorbia lathyris TaxID=212925 RepID=UPI0033137652
MAVSSLYPFNPTLPSHSKIPPSHSLSTPTKLRELVIDTRRRRSRVGRLVVSSTHSNAKILKSNKKSRFGKPLSPYVSDEDSDDIEEEEEDDDDDDDWLLDDEFAEPAEFEIDGKKSKSQNKVSRIKGGQRQSDVRSSRNTQEKRIGRNLYNAKSKAKEGSLHGEINGKLTPNISTQNRYEKLSDEIDFDKKWIPLVDYLSTFGLKDSDFIQMYERHMPCLQINVYSAKERLEYLMSIGVKQRDIRRMLLRQPQILQYTVENNLKSHVSFLSSLGIPNSRIGQIIAATPSLFSYSVENSLKPTVRYLVEEVGINEKSLGKVVQLSPQILVQRIDVSWNMRYMFLSKELGASRDNVVKMVMKHPQLLHYSIDDGLLPRIKFLRSIGMSNSDILKVLTSLTQVLSLSLEDNLKPKYIYLINELRNEVHSLTKYPMYFSLSLDQRIRPRHRFLVSLKKAPKGPFPLSSFVPTDENFCDKWAGTSLDKYLAFRQQLQLTKFARKYERQ